MIPLEMKNRLLEQIGASEHPRELIIDVMFELQRHYGYLNHEAVSETADLLDMTRLEVEELATFYDFIYREPVGNYVIHVCDGTVCWMSGEESIVDYLCRTLGVKKGEITEDGMFTVLPSSCIGFCDQAPAMLINGKAYGGLDPEKIDAVLDKLRKEHKKLTPNR